MAERAQRLAIMLLHGLDHFTHDLVAKLPCAGLEVRGFHVRGMADLAAACAWADDASQDVIWFEFCWPPFPAMIAQYDFEGRRVVMRVHRIEAYETRHAATAPWAKIDDVIVVSQEMAMRVEGQAPALRQTTRLHVVHNGVDVDRFAPSADTVRDAFRIGWCGSLIVRKNPVMALEILHLLRQEDARWHLHLCSQGGEALAVDSFNHLKHRLGLDDAVVNDGKIEAAHMPAWHARNAVLVSTSLHESFGYAMAEAASCGCDVVMLDQAGADEFWPEEMRFGTALEAAAMIQTARPDRWREMVVQRFSLAQQVEKLRCILRPVGESGDELHIGVDDELLDVLTSAHGAVRLDMRPADEMEAAAFLLGGMGYFRTGKSGGSVLYHRRG
jgi:glycosyltransferase involved in cell wall biosynthesis